MFDDDGVFVLVVVVVEDSLLSSSLSEDVKMSEQAKACGWKAWYRATDRKRRGNGCAAGTEKQDVSVDGAEANKENSLTPAIIICAFNSGDGGSRVMEALDGGWGWADGVTVFDIGIVVVEDDLLRCSCCGDGGGCSIGNGGILDGLGSPLRLPLLIVVIRRRRLKERWSLSLSYLTFTLFVTVRGAACCSFPSY